MVNILLLFIKSFFLSQFLLVFSYTSPVVPKQYSQDGHASSGGYVGFVEQGDLVESMDEVIFSLLPGNISDVLESEQGYHLFKVGKRIPRKEKSFEEASEEIRDKVFRQKAHERFEQWMTDLKKRAFISIR